MSEERGKLEITIALKCDARLVAALDRYQRERELGASPLTRSLLVRMMLEESLGLRAPPLPRARE
jgi:hypothetical protein